MTASYTIKFTATDDATQSSLLQKQAFSITDNTIDTTTTSLKLLGKGSSPFGDTLWSNMVHMLENFCSKNEPLHPTTGQLWYDSGLKKLKLCEESNNAHIWTDLGGGSGTTSTNYFTTSNSGLVLSGYDVNIAQNLKVGGAVEVLGDTKVVKMTASGSLLSSAKTNNEFMNNITSDDAKFKPYFITKAYADEHYFGGVNFNNTNEFDTSSTFSTVILPAKVVHTGIQIAKSVALPIASGTNIIDISEDSFREGTVFNATGFTGATGVNPTIKLPSAIDYNNCTITVSIQYAASAAEARSKTLEVNISGTANNTILWEGGTKPTTSAAGIDVFQFMSLNEFWFGVVIGKGFA